MTVTRYRKREPIEVDAVRVTIENIAEVKQWCGGQVVNASYASYLDENDEEHPAQVQSVGVKLLTKNRLQVALIGDYIYKDHEGYFHKMPLGEFHFEYEPIQEENNE